MSTDLAASLADLRHGARARLRFLDEQLFWEGRVNRADLMARFQVSVPQATHDLGKYQELAPGNLAYDKQAKAYVTTPAFRPVFGMPSAEAWLRAQAHRLAEGGMEVEDLPLPRREIDPLALRRIVTAWRSHRSLHVEYQAMDPGLPEPSWRWITPRAFAFDGFRWHLRAYNHEMRRHEDMLLPRIFAFGEERESGPTPPDEDWEQVVTVQLRAARGLSPTQRQAIEADYRMAGGRADVHVRAALLPALIRRMRLDYGTRFVEVVNEEEVRAVLQRVAARFAGGAEG